MDEEENEEAVANGNGTSASLGNNVTAGPLDNLDPTFVDYEG